MAGKGRGGDGIRALGVIRGVRWWEIRLPYTDPRTGKRRDTKRKVQANSKALALIERDRLLKELKEGASRERKRFGDALDAYFERPMAHSSRMSRASYAKALRAHFGDWWLDAITRRDLSAYMSALPYGTSGQGTVKAILQRTFAIAIDKGWLTESPAEHIKLRDDSVERAHKEALEGAPKRALEPDEAVAFLTDLRARSPLLYPLVATQYVVMCRFAEVSALAPKDVDLESGIVTVRRGQVSGHLGPTKGKYARVVGLPLTLRVELKEYRAMVVEQGWPGHEEFFFPRPPGGWRRASNAWSIDTASDHIRASFERLGLSHMRSVTHAARHTGISLAAMQKELELVLRKVAGHSSLRQTGVYTSVHHAAVIDLAERQAAMLPGEKKKGPG
jgi:integrase